MSNRNNLLLHIKSAIYTCFVLLQLNHGESFASLPVHSSLALRKCTSKLFLAGKKKNGPQKLSYAERLQRQRDEKTRKQESLMDTSTTTTTTTTASTSDNNPSPEQQLAKQLIEAQRQSVDMLTYIRERVEVLPWTSIEENLNKEGFVVIDDFLASDDAVTKLQAEGRALYEKEMMETDLTRLGSGEYICVVKGGEEQYAVCPRTIELVVSVTKHLPTYLPTYNLDGSNCMARMRTYDRDSKLASRSLLQSDELPVPPFDVVANVEADTRKLTLFYYLTDYNWSDGGIVIEQGERLLSSKRDRLIMLLSDSCRHRLDYFEGAGGLVGASCLELHLIEIPSRTL